MTLHCANGLIACDSFGKSDPYCYVDLGNQRFRSRTIYKTVNPGMTSKTHLIAFDIVVAFGASLNPSIHRLKLWIIPRLKSEKFQNFLFKPLSE